MASRILLADDSITIQKVVNLTFADEGIDVVAVSNGDLAERRLAEVSPDLVLADIFMPGKNGYELCEAIKENPQFHNVPVVLLVGAFEPFDQAEARRVKADAHLTKPFESRTLVETVRRLISASWRTTTGPIAPTQAAENGKGDGLDSHSAETTTPPIAPSLPGKLDLSAMVGTGVAPPTQQVRNTGELASPSPQAAPEAFGFGIVDAPAPEAVSARLTDTSARFEPLEFSRNGDFSPVEVAPSFDLHVGDSLSLEETPGFDTPEPIDLSSEQNPTLFATVPQSDLSDIDISGNVEGEPWYDTGSLAASGSSESSEGAGWRTLVNGSPLSYQQPEFNLQTETGYSVSESTETACATLLAVDEPLGDVLFDETVPVDSLSAVETTSNDSPGLELGDAGAAVAEFEPSRQFDLVEIVETPQIETYAVVKESTTAEQFAAQPLDHVMVDAVEEVAVPQFQVSENVVESTSAPSNLEQQPETQQAAPDLDWTTPKAASYSTAQLDSVMMPIETAEYLTETSLSEDAQPSGDIEDAAFTTPATWTEEEARFTPIDIEAVAVEDTVVEETSPLMSASASDLAPAEPASNGEALVAERAVTAVDSSPDAPLSSAAIEEIVRRVVAEMSESVVREIAWEVVPDCVERVIDQLTRESLAKRA